MNPSDPMIAQYGMLAVMLLGMYFKWTNIFYTVWIRIIGFLCAFVLYNHAEFLTDPYQYVAATVAVVAMCYNIYVREQKKKNA